MKTTAFTKYHIANGAKMAEFAGYNMPIEFSGINDEHMTVREKAGVFDVSHMGEIWIKGDKATALLQHITSNDVSKLYDGKVQYYFSDFYKGLDNPNKEVVLPIYEKAAGVYDVEIRAVNSKGLESKTATRICDVRVPGYRRYPLVFAPDAKYF